MEGNKAVKALLDTNVIIDILKGNEQAILKIEQLKKDYALYTTTVNIYEILRGIKLLKKDNERHLQALEAMAANLSILAIDIPASKSAAEVYADLRKKGIEIDEQDYLIAGACISNGIDAMVTRNERHFNGIKSLKIITY